MKMMLTSRSSAPLAALLGALSVGLGAFGSHALQDMLTADAMSTWGTGARYLQWHAVYLLVLGLAWRYQSSESRFRLPIILGFLGILIFSGSVMTLAVSGIRILGAVAPIGGICLIASWVLAARALWTSKSDPAS